MPLCYKLSKHIVLTVATSAGASHALRKTTARIGSQNSRKMNKCKQHDEQQRDKRLKRLKREVAKPNFALVDIQTAEMAWLAKLHAVYAYRMDLFINTMPNAPITARKNISTPPQHAQTIFL